MNKEEKYLLAKQKYYQGQPIMSDAEFDNLEKELEKENSEVIKIVGFGDRNLKFPHQTPMLSLKKFQTDKITGKPPVDEVMHWISTRNPNEILEYTPKFDGNAANVIYKNGKLQLALSRGNGKEGRNITNKLIHQLPKTIPINEGIVEVRGEVLIERDVFKKKYSTFKNERNFVAGVLNKDENEDEVLNDLVLMVVEIKHIYNNVINYIPVYKFQEFDFNLKHNLFTIFAECVEFEEVFKEMNEYREKYSPFLLDGFVIKLSEKFRNQFGEDSHSPNWAVAIKFIPKDHSTTVNDIKWQFGKTGHYVPVGHLDPIDLDGAIIKRVSMYNYGYIIENNVYPGANVTIAKSGDIIPQIINVNTSGDKSKFNLPTTCEYCDTNLEIENNIHLICPNKNCDGIKMYQFRYAINQLEIFGLGKSMIDKLWLSGITSAIDILDPYKFNKDVLLAAGIIPDGKLIDNILNEVEKIKSITLDKLILLIGFENMGHSIATQVANYIAGVKYSFSGLTKEVVNGFDENGEKRKLVLETVEKLKNYVEIIYPKTETQDININIKVELTGSPKSAGFSTKGEFLNKIKEYGYSHAKLKEATYLITDDLSSTSSKMKTAQKNGIKILTYEQLIKKIN